MPEASTIATGHSNIRSCTVQLLDDVAIQVEFKKTDLGSVIMDQVCNHLMLAERDYFGLRYIDQHLHRYWLDPSKPVLKQRKASDSLVFAFRVKFYPADPTILKEELTRYLLVLQLRRDLLHGRLHCPQNDLATLAAYIVQGEIGDYDAMVHVGNYVSQFKIVINQSPKVEEKVIQVHKTLEGETPADVDTNFLIKASSLDTYGYYPYTIKDSKAGQVYMGATPKGILIYQTSRKLHDIRWDDVENFDYSGKDFYIYPKRAYFDQHAIDQKSSSKKKPHLKFICPNSTYSKHMWKYMLAQKAFFTSPKSDQVKAVVKRHLLFRNATFRWHPANKVLEELRSVQSPPRLKCPTFERQKIPRQANRDERNGPWANKFHTMPSRVKASAQQDVLGVTPTPPQSKSSVEAPELSVGTAAGGIRPTILRYDNAIVSATTTSNAAVERLSPIVGVTDASSTKASPPVLASPLTSTPKRSSDVGVNGKLVATVVAKTNRTDATAERSAAASSAVVKRSPAAGVRPPAVAAATPTVTPPRRPSRRLAAMCCRATLLTLLVTMAVAALVVAAMEWRDDRWRRLVDRQPLVDDFRHRVYEPTRRYVCDRAARLL